MFAHAISLDIDKSAHAGARHRSQETTKDAPKAAEREELTAQDQQELMELVRKFKQGWFLARRSILKRVLKAHEFFKGNHFISFDPESFQWFDALEAAFTDDDSRSEDLNLYQFATNFYQMLAFAFVAALSSQVPKSRFLPDDAEKEEDIATAKVSSTVQEIIERKNEVKSLHKQALLELWLSGCYFRHTRYVVDAERAGTHREPEVSVTAQQIMSGRHVCSKCGASTEDPKIGSSGDRAIGPSAKPERLLRSSDGSRSQQNQRRHSSDEPMARWPDGPMAGQSHGPICNECGAELSPSDYFPAESAEMPFISQYKDVANGLVKQDIYGPLHIDVHPRAEELAQTPILNLETEVSVAALRAMYPEKWEAIRDSGGGMSPQNQEEKLARALLYSEGGSRSQFMNEQLPTYSRTWIQSWAFNEIDNKERAEKFRRLFPDGCLLCNVGDTFLEVRAAKLTEEWSWCGTVKGKFGMFPPAVGDAAIPVQERVNDTCNITHEYMDRLAGGVILADQELIGTDSMNGKPIMPGVLNPVKRKKGTSAPLRDQIVQIKAELDVQIYSYTDKLVFWMQLLVGTPPQIFGGSGDPHIETASGQSQQLSTAMGKLGLFWDNTREESARAAELAVNCAAANMNDDWFDVVTDSSGQFRNQYVYMDDMRGSIHAYPETDQGFPMTHAEIKDFWEKLIEWGSSGNNPYANAMLDEPANQEQIAIWTGVPGLVVPGRNMRNKVLQIIDRLRKEQPIVQQIGAQAGPPFGENLKAGSAVLGQTITMPSIQVDPLVDDIPVAIQTLKEYLQEHWELADDNPPAWANLVAYLKLCLAFKQKEEVKQATAQASGSAHSR